MEHDRAAGPIVLAHGAGAVLDEESERPVVDRRVCRRFGRGGGRLVPEFPRVDIAVPRISEPAAHPDPRWRADRLSAGGVAEGQPALGAGAGVRTASWYCAAHPADGCRFVQRHRTPVELNPIKLNKPGGAPSAPKTNGAHRA